MHCGAATAETHGLQQKKRVPAFQERDLQLPFFCPCSLPFFFVNFAPQMAGGVKGVPGSILDG
jgi:hypothetical protein